MDKIFSTFLQHERQGNFHVSEDSTFLMNATDSQILKGKSHGSNSFGRGNNRVCSHYGKTNHSSTND